MSASQLRAQMQQQINTLPEDILREVADFMAFILSRRQIDDWDDEIWQQMALEQFFREETNSSIPPMDVSLNEI